MCDKQTERDIDAALGNVMTRRRFATVTVAAATAAIMPRAKGAPAVTGENLSVGTPDGEADCYFTRPATGRHAGVIVWPDILGLRPAFRAMGDRLASSGYAVLVVNPYYRQARAPVVPEGASFRDAATRETVMPLYQSLSAEGNVTDAKAFVEFLDTHSAVDTARKIGTTGYCMGGPMTMRTAAAVPDRIGAGASFHGGGLATRDENSPHLLVPEMRASFLFAIAENDDENDPEAKVKLRAAFDAANLDAEIEVYAGAMHGWCPPDSAVYNEEQAERAWARLLALFEGALA